MGGKPTKIIQLHQGPANGKSYRYPSPLPKTLVISQVSHTKDSMGLINGGVLIGQHDYERLRDTQHYLWKGKVAKPDPNGPECECGCECGTECEPDCKCESCWGTDETTEHKPR